MFTFLLLCILVTASIGIGVAMGREREHYTSWFTCLFNIQEEELEGS